MVPQRISPVILLISLVSIQIGAFVLQPNQHKCPSCATSKFIKKQWLMQDVSSGHAMEWSDWKGTDCDRGVAYVVPCNGSCLTVKIEKLLTINEYLYSGTMQECSDNFIHASPDLPPNIDFGKFYEDADFVSKRRGHRITYNFHRQSIIDKHDESVRKLREIEAAKEAEEKARAEELKNSFGFRDVVVIVSIFLSFVIVVSIIALYLNFFSFMRELINARRNVELELGHQKDSEVVEPHSSVEQKDEQKTDETADTVSSVANEIEEVSPAPVDAKEV
ncbi:unnamed protein product [Caenorhabditis brenneri]